MHRGRDGVGAARGRVLLLEVMAALQLCGADRRLDASLTRAVEVLGDAVHG
jgi:hypothetical protein